MSAVMFLGALAVGCAPDLAALDARVPEDAVADATPDPRDGASSSDDVLGSDAATTPDAAIASDAAATPDVTLDATSADVSVADGTTPTADVPAADVRPGDVSGADASASDVGSGTFRDAAVVDVPCTGTAPVVTVVAPTSEQVIETCSASEAAVYFDFVASVSGPSPVASVGARWITPDGAEAPPPATLTATPYAFRRQVGGPSAATPALAVFGLRGGWRVEFTATDACGRRGTASQSFSLTFTNRRCPNP